MLSESSVVPCIENTSPLKHAVLILSLSSLYTHVHFSSSLRMPGYSAHLIHFGISNFIATFSVFLFDKRANTQPHWNWTVYYPLCFAQTRLLMWITCTLKVNLDLIFLRNYVSILNFLSISTAYSLGCLCYLEWR
jgi:hypothetical protein